MALTEHEAGANLERAINDWAEACGWNTDGDFPTGWVLLVDYVSIDQAGVGNIGVSTSDGLTLVHQLGLLDYARTLAHRKIQPGEAE